MEVPSVHIRDFTFESLEITTRETFDSARPINCQVSVQFGVAGHPENPHAFKIDLKLTFGADELEEPPNLPYATTVMLSGYFDTPMEVIPTGVPVPAVLNGLMILYGVARGYIGQTTSSFRHGRFVIPSVVFDSVVERASRTDGSGVVPSNVHSPAVEQPTGQR